MHVWSPSLSHNYRVFIRGCFAVLVLGPGVPVVPKATLSRAALLCLAAGRSPGSESWGQSHQTRRLWRAVCSRCGLEVAVKWSCSPTTSPGEVTLRCPGSPPHRCPPAASPGGW